MNDYPIRIKNNLNTIISNMALSPSEFVKNPAKDFTRNRKLSFQTIIQFILSMGGNTLAKELLEYWNYDLMAPTPSAFVQQRKKILPYAFEYLLKVFIQSMDDSLQLYKGYRLLAIDGSRVHMATDQKEELYYLQSRHNRAGYNLIHLNALYDLCNKLYLDIYLQPAKEANENKAFMELLNRTQITDNR